MTAGWEIVGDVSAFAPSWVLALGELRDVVRSHTADAGQYQYRYAELAAVTSHAREVLATHDLALFQTAVIDGDEVSVTTTVMHTSGAYLVFAPFRLPAGRSAQQVGSAATYARRYALMAQLGLATEDDDGAGAAPRTSPDLNAPLPGDRVAAFIQACTDANLSSGERGDIVEEATKGRTREPTEVRMRELPALHRAFTWRTSPTAPAVAEDESGY